MAIYRQIQTTFWQDAFVLSLTPEEKYFYIYLMTNSKTKQCGIYELPLQIAQIETGYNRETVIKLIQKFIEHGKIAFDWENCEIAIRNWAKYNPVSNPNVEKCVKRELSEVKNVDLIPLVYPLQAPTKPIRNNNKNNNKNNNNNNNESPTAPIVFPEKFNTNEFRSAWEQFLVMRSEIKKPLKETGQKMQIKFLSDFDVGTAIKMLNRSTANQWQGIFELNGANNGNGANRANGNVSGATAGTANKYAKFVAAGDARKNENPQTLHG